MSEKAGMFTKRENKVQRANKDTIEKPKNHRYIV